MAQQEEDGWPLGLQPLNVRNGHFSAGSVSFNTLHTGSPVSSTDSSSDFDTESTGSFFHDRSITLGSLIGASHILDLSRKVEASKGKKSNKKTKTWLFSLCSRDATDTRNNAQSLGHFLAVERRAANGCRRNTTPSPNSTIYRTGELPLGPPVMGWNPLFDTWRLLEVVNGMKAEGMVEKWKMAACFLVCVGSLLELILPVFEKKRDLVNFNFDLFVREEEFI